MEGDASPVFRGALGSAIVSLYQNGGYDERRGNLCKRVFKDTNIDSGTEFIGGPLSIFIIN